jgi:ubiquinone biosynthesis protein UbiJ
VSELRLPALHTAGLAAAEAAVNAALRLSPHSLEALKPLQDQVLALVCTRPAIILYINSEASGELRLRGVYDGPVSTRVLGSAEDFATLARAEDPAATLINGGIQLEGSSSTLIDMQRVFNGLDIDWEAPLVDGLGDVAGHQLASMLTAAFQWSRQASSSLRRQLGEFALEEARLAPPRLALEDFYADVEELTERSDRLAQRVETMRLRLERLRDR